MKTKIVKVRESIKPVRIRKHFKICKILEAQLFNKETAISRQHSAVRDQKSKAEGTKAGKQLTINNGQLTVIN